MGHRVLGLVTLALAVSASATAATAAAPRFQSQKVPGPAAQLRTQVPVCGLKDRTVEGPIWSPCAAMDTACVSGVYDPEAECCFIEPVPPGVGCGTGTCDGLGTCTAPKDPKDRDGDQIADEQDAVLGRDFWVRATRGQPSIWYEEDRVRVRLDGEDVLSLPIAPPLDLSRVQVSVSPDVKKRRFVRVAAPTEWVEVVLPARGASEVCYATAEAAEQGPLPANCESKSVHRLRCGDAGAEAEGGFTCLLEGGEVRLRGPKVAFAWLPRKHDDDTDIRLLDLPWLVTTAECRRCQLTPGDRLPVLRLEVCNGVDDDQDGHVDEGPNWDCDDGRPCTSDSCEGARGCRNQGRDDACRIDFGACMLSQCAEPFVGGPNQGATETADFNGCHRLFRHDYCQALDGCQCNGPELCSPFWVGSPDRRLEGCHPASRQQLPCEVNDGDLCSVESCCESNPDACSTFRELQARDPAAAQLYRDACSLASLNSDSTPDGMGGLVSCPRDPRHVGEYGAVCDDGNPCTADTCIGPGGNCRRDPLDGPQPGCEGSVERGCARQECVAGVCTKFDTAPKVSEPSQCHGWVPWWLALGPPPYTPNPTCVRNECQGTGPGRRCVHVEEHSVCDDGLFCDGGERCDLSVVLGFSGPGVVTTAPDEGMAFTPTPSPFHIGCRAAARGPCSDGIDCTVDTCDEATDRCGLHVPDDFACHTSRGLELEYSICAPRYRCAVTASSEADGCSPLPARFNPCDDGNICTRDICQCDEFCVSALTCQYRDVCEIVPPPPRPGKPRRP